MPAPPGSLNAAGELKDLQPALKQRLELGRWTALHLRIAELHAHIAHGKGVRAGGAKAVEGVPTGAAWGWPDWVCLHPDEPRPLIIELKTEKGVLTLYQCRWIQLWRSAGAEVAVVRPRDVLVPNDALYQRLVAHSQCAGGVDCRGDRFCTGWCRALKEALAA